MNTGIPTATVVRNAGQKLATSGVSSPSRSAIADHNAIGSTITSLSTATSCFLPRDSRWIRSIIGSPGFAFHDHELLGNTRSEVDAEPKQRGRRNDYPQPLPGG